MQDIATRLNKIKNDLPESCTLVAVSKTKPNAAILEAYQTGQKDFGENKVQELTQKAAELPKDIQWHMIGHLQRNKVKYIAPFIHLIHSVDSIRLLQEVNKQGERNNRVINCLLQVHIAKEDSKFGFDENELVALVENNDLATLHFVKVIGLMGMATFTDDKNQVHQEFKVLGELFESFKKYEMDNFLMQTLSMGMSGDYEIAVKEGSTMVRVGSVIFGERNN